MARSLNKEEEEEEEEEGEKRRKGESQCFGEKCENESGKKNGEPSFP